jgi:hypothetical protein
MERVFRNQPGINDFPFTHGDLIEAIRVKAKEEMQSELRQMIAEKEAQERARLESTYPDLLNQSSITSQRSQ